MENIITAQHKTNVGPSAVLLNQNSGIQKTTNPTGKIIILQTNAFEYLNKLAQYVHKPCEQCVHAVASVMLWMEVHGRMARLTSLISPLPVSITIHAHVESFYFLSHFVFLLLPVTLFPFYFLSHSSPQP